MNSSRGTSNGFATKHMGLGRPTRRAQVWARRVIDETENAELGFFASRSITLSDFENEWNEYDRWVQCIVCNV